MADKVNNITTRFTADVSAFLKDTQSMKRGIAQANAEFKNATAGMDKWQDSTEGLEAKLTQLNKTVQIEKKRLADMVAEYEELEKAGKANTTEAQKLATQILNQGAKVKKTEADIAKYEKSLEEMSEEAKKGGKEVKDLGEAAKDSGDGFTVAKGAIAGFIANGLTALANAAKNAVTSVLGLSEATREYRTNSAKLQTGFEAAGHSAEDAKETYTELYSVLGDEGKATEAAAHLAQLSKDQQDLAKWTKLATGIYATFGDSLPIEGLTEAANETAKTGAITGSLADALNWADTAGMDFGIGLKQNIEFTKLSAKELENLTEEELAEYEAKKKQYEETEKYNQSVTEAVSAEDKFQLALDNCTTEQERQALITETLNSLYGDQAEAFKETNKNVIDANKAQAKFTQAQADLGAKVEPITTRIKVGFANVLEEVLKLVEDVDFDKLAGMIDSAFDKFINDIIPKIVEGIQWIIDNKDTVIAGIVGIGAAFVAWKVVSVVTAAKKALDGMTVAQWLLNQAMNANVIGIIITAIAALVAAFIYLWNNCEGFREFWINLWEKIKSTAKTAWEAIKGFFSAAWEWIVSVWNSAGEWFAGIWQGIKNAFSAVTSWFSNIFQKAWSGIKKAWSGVKNFFSGIWSGIKNVFSSVTSWFGNIFQKAWTAIKNVFSSVGEFFGGIWETIKEKFTTIGTKVAEAIGGAFKTAINAVIATVEGAINTIPKAINGAIGLINELPGVNISKIPTVSLPRLAKGAVVDKSTIAEIGEAGREAIIPLDRNTRGLDLIADKISERMGGKGGVTVNNYNTFTNMPTTRYAMYRANKQGIASWQLFLAQQGGK